ncbi:MAG: efflux RND transporter periplasmic adaptor subunit [bacterium]
MGVSLNRVRKRFLLPLVLFALAALGAAWFLTRGRGDRSVEFRTVPVERGDLVAAISATGTVEPEELVDVGAQVAGQIVAFGKDRSGKTVDYGSAVEQGMVLAQIDDSVYRADVVQAKAALEQARAGVLRAQADLGQMQARLVQSSRDWERARELGPSEALSKSDFDAARSDYEVAQANVAVGRAAIAQAREAVSQAEAALARAQRNLDYCTIRSPVAGVIIDRRVNIGQTVVASLNAPSLFLIAKDLKRMQVWVAVNEADIGNVHPGQPVTFTVDAYPGETFQGAVGKIRLNASMTQNVVTYTVEVTTDNSNGRLLPYLTANAKFLVKELHGVLLVPNAALRYTPALEHVAPAERETAEADKLGGPPAADGNSPDTGKASHDQGFLWTPYGQYLQPIPVSVGLTDGTMTEIRGDGLEEGTPVVVGEQSLDEKAATPPTSSPFTPRIDRSKRPPRR